MSILRRIVRAMFWGVVVAGVLWLLRRWMASRAREVDSRQPPTIVPPAPVLLRRDPVCGTHVAPEISFTLEQSGQTEYFCSAECRDRYTRSYRRAANG